MANVTHLVDRGKQNYLASLDQRQAECMSQGHAWPKIRAGKPLPKGVEVEPQRSSQYQVNETCGTCGSVRTWTTLPGGAFDMDIQYRYQHPKWWVVQETGTGVTRRDIKADIWSQAAAGLRAARAAQ